MATPSGPPKTIMLAIHDHSVSKQFSVALHGAGHRTVTVRTRATLMQELKAAPPSPDLMVLDLRLGEGVDLARAVRTLSPGVPIVILSGSVRSATDVRELVPLGVDSYVNDHCAVPQILPALAPRLFPDSFDRRTSVRVTLNLPVAYRFGDTVATAPTLDLSRGGLGVRTMAPLDVGTEVRVQFRLPASQGDIEATSRVTWSNQRSGMGLQFENVQPPGQAAIDEFVDQQASVHRPSA